MRIQSHSSYILLGLPGTWETIKDPHLNAHPEQFEGGPMNRADSIDRENKIEVLTPPMECSN